MTVTFLALSSVLGRAINIARIVLFNENVSEIFALLFQYMLSKCEDSEFSSEIKYLLFVRNNKNIFKFNENDNAWPRATLDLVKVMWQQHEQICVC